jgi:hypothetical protein
LTGVSGEAAAPGSYSFFVEGSLRWKNRVIYAGVITIGGEPVTVQAEAEFFYEASNGRPASSDASPEIGMIGAVTASYIPDGAE